MRLVCGSSTISYTTKEVCIEEFRPSTSEQRLSTSACCFRRWITRRRKGTERACFLGTKSRQSIAVCWRKTAEEAAATESGSTL